MIKKMKISMPIIYFLSYGGIIGMLFTGEYRLYYSILAVIGILFVVLKNLKYKTLGVMVCDFCIGILAVLMGYFIPDKIGFFKQFIVACLLAIYTAWIIDYQKKVNELSI